jgi:predicted  nucleic acid-binding Zn-ribbon protein
MAGEEEIRAKIEELEKRKAELIEKIKKINRRLRYKKYEQKALEPFLEQTKTVVVEPYRRKKRILEFKISTQAYTPKLEKEWLKEVKKVDKKLDELKEVERARRKKRYIEKDIAEAEKEVEKIETELKSLREDLKKLYDAMREYKAAARKAEGAEKRAREEMVSLGDLALIEKEER